MIPAGQSGKLVAKVHTRPTQNGNLRKSVSVSTDSPDAPSFSLTLSFEVKAMIKVLPRAQLSLRGVVGEVSGEPTGKLSRLPRSRSRNRVSIWRSNRSIWPRGQLRA